MPALRQGSASAAPIDKDADSSRKPWRICYDIIRRERMKGAVPTKNGIGERPNTTAPNDTLFMIT